MIKYLKNLSSTTIVESVNQTTVSKDLQVTSNTSSTSTATGALKIVGGLGLTGNVNASAIYSGGYFYANGAALSSTITFTGGTVANAVAIQSTTNSTSTTVGALTVAGGAGIAGNLNANSVYTNNYFYANGAPLVDSIARVTSVGLASSDLTVTGSPITTSGNISVALATTGVLAGTYKSVTVDTKGRVTNGTNPTTLAGYGITDGISATSTDTLSNKTLTAPVINSPKVKGEQAVTSSLGTLTTGTTTVDLSTAQVFAATLAAASTVTFAFSNAPAAGQSQMIMLQLTNAGNSTIVWPAGTKFSNGAVPVLTATGIDLLGVFYNTILSCYIVFLLGKDIK